MALAASGHQWGTMAALGHADLRTTSVYQSTTTARAAAVGAAATAEILPEAGAPPGSTWFTTRRLRPQTAIWFGEMSWSGRRDSSSRPLATKGGFHMQHAA